MTIVFPLIKLLLMVFLTWAARTHGTRHVTDPCVLYTGHHWLCGPRKMPQLPASNIWERVVCQLYRIFVITKQDMIYRKSPAWSVAHTRHWVMGCYYDVSLVLLLPQSLSHSITENIQLEIIKVALLKLENYITEKNSYLYY